MAWKAVSPLAPRSSARACTRTRLTHTYVHAHVRVFVRPLHFHTLRSIPTRPRARDAPRERARVRAPRVSGACVYLYVHAMGSAQIDLTLALPSPLLLPLLAPRIARLHNGGGRSARSSPPLARSLARSRGLLTFPGLFSSPRSSEDARSESFYDSEDFSRCASSFGIDRTVLGPFVDRFPLSVSFSLSLSISDHYLGINVNNLPRCVSFAYLIIDFYLILIYANSRARVIARIIENRECEVFSLTSRH